MSEYTTGLVSVIMPTYKRSEKLSRAIESVLAQTYTNLELLLVNDNEPDDDYTRELCERVACYSADKRFQLIAQDRHVNGAVARNVGICQARGEYIAFLDDDDWWKPEKLEQQVAVLSELPEQWGGVSCKIEQYDDDVLIARSYKYADGYIYKDILNLQSDVATGTLLLRHAALDDAGYFDESLLRHQDLQLLTQFTYRYALMEVDEYLHCCDVSDAQNRPDGEKLLEHKKRFFASVKNVMDTLTPSERRCIYGIHSFEVGYVFFKNRQMGKCFRYCMKVFVSTRSVIYAVKKVWGTLAAKI